MIYSIVNIVSDNKLLQIRDSLYVKVFIDPERYVVGKHMTYEVWQEVSTKLEKACEQAVRNIFLVTGALPKTGDKISYSTDPCLIVATRFDVYDDGILAWFECEQTTN